MVAWPYLKGKCTLPTVDTTGNAQQRAYDHRLSFYSLLRRIPLQAFLEQALLFSFFHSELQICVLVPPSPRLWQKALEGTDRAEVYTCRTTAPVTTTTIGADLQSRTTVLGCRGLGAMDGILVPVPCRIE
jgi:hypothetical protein